MIRQIALGACLTLALAACEEPPDLAPIEASFAKGTAGASGTRVSRAHATTTFGKSVATAVRRHPDLRRAQAQINIAQAEALATQGAYVPSVSLGAQAVREGGANSVGPYVTVSQLVYDGGAARNDAAAARATVLQREGDRLQAASAATLNAVETYAAVLTRRKLLDLAKENLKVHAEFVDQIDARLESGAAVQSDALTAQSRLANARTGEIDARANLDRAEAEYRQIFNTTPGTMPAPSSAPALPKNTAQIVAQAPRIRALEAGIGARFAEINAAKARRLPSISAGATASYTDAAGSDIGFNLGVSYSLDRAGQRKAAVAAADARLLDALAERDALAADIRRALDFVRSDQKAGAARVAAARQAATASSSNVNALREEFTVGGRSLLEVLDGQRDLLAAQETLIQAETELLLTGYAALALTGDILDAFGISVRDL